MGENSKLKQSSTEMEAKQLTIATENKSLNDKNMKNTEEINKLQQSLAESSKKVGFLEDEVKKAKEDKSSAIEIQTLKNKLTSHEAQIADFKTKLQSNTETEKSTSDALTAKTKEVNDLKTKVSESDSKLSESMKKQQELTNELSGKDSKIKELNDNITSLEAKMKTQEAKIQSNADVGQSVAAKDQEIATLNTKLSALTKDMEDKLSLLQKKTSDQEKVLQEKTSVMDNLKKEKDILKKSVEDNENKLKEQEKKIQTFESLEKEKSLIETKMKKEESVQRGLREIIAKHEATIGKKEDDASALQKRNQEVIGDKNKKIAELNSEIQRMKETQAEWENKVKNMTDGQKGT